MRVGTKQDPGSTPRRRAGHVQGGALPEAQSSMMLPPTGPRDGPSWELGARAPRWRAQCPDSAESPLGTSELP